MVAPTVAAQNAAAEEEQTVSDSIQSVIQRLMDNQRRLEERFESLEVTRVESGRINWVNQGVWESLPRRCPDERGMCWSSTHRRAAQRENSPRDTVAVGTRIADMEGGAERYYGLNGVRGRVAFGRPFLAAPHVLLALSSIHMDRNDSHARVHIEVTAVDEHGFDYEAYTGPATTVYVASLEWMAAGR